VAITPLTIDMYLPALPTITADLSTSAATVQLTLTGTLVGLALGQLVLGPLSDRYGRRGPLLAGTALHVLASLLVLLAPDVAVLGALRVLQGVGTAAGAVISLAVVRDLFTGRKAATLLSRIFLILGAAPVLAPTIGGAILRFTTWRGVFVLLAGYGVALLVAGWLLATGLLDPHGRPRTALRVARGHPLAALVIVGAALLAAGGLMVLPGRIGQPTLLARAPAPAAAPAERAAANAGAALAPAVPTALPTAPAVPTVLPAAPAAPTLVPTVVPTAAPPAPTPTAPRPQTGPLLDESFVGTQRAWPSDPRGVAWIAPDGYHLAARQPARFVAVGAPGVGPLQNVSVTGSFHKVSGPVGGGYGLIVRDQGGSPRDGQNQRGRFYVFEVGDRGEFGVWRRDEDHWVDLVPWTASAVVQPGTAANTLAVRAVGEQLLFTVNGVQVASARDGTLAAGAVGLFAGGDGNEVVGERLTVQRLD
jgi:MFS family permease